MGLPALPGREGHFRLESGLHTDRWLTLDALFASPGDAAPLITALAARLKSYSVAGVCGPLVGGAFLAQSLAAALGVDFYFSEPETTPRSAGLFSAEYRVPAGLRSRMSGARLALVDDVISAGSSVRATAKAVAGAGASIVVVGTLLALGTVALDHFARLEIPVEALERRELSLWSPETCPLCRAGAALHDGGEA